MRLVYRLAARLTDRRTAIAAAIFLAVSPLHVRDSHYVKHDVPATLAIVLALPRDDARVAVAHARTRSTDCATRSLAGAACGVAFSTHYYCVFLALPLSLAIVQRMASSGGWRAVRRATLRRGAASAVASSSRSRRFCSSSR